MPLTVTPTPAPAADAPAPAARRRAARSCNVIIPHGFEANYVLGFCKGLQANGLDLLVVSSDEIEARVRQAGLPQLNLRGSQQENRSVVAKAANFVRYYVQLLWLIFRTRGGTHHFVGLLGSRIILLDGVVLPLWLRLWSGRYLHTAHNALPHSREHSRFFHHAYRWIYRFPHTILVHTGKVAEQLEHTFGVEPRRIVTISIGLNEEVPAAPVDQAEARRRLGVPADARLALFFGKIERYKGVDLLLQAWDQVKTPRARLVIAGQCPDSGYAAELQRARAAAAAPESIDWREGFVPNDAVALWLTACDVVVMPYRNIYQSGVVFLCLQFGVPIVATRVGSLAEYVDAGSGIIADSGDPAAFSRALDAFFAAPDRFDRAQIRARATRYSWPRQCAGIKHLYNGY